MMTQCGGRGYWSWAPANGRVPESVALNDPIFPSYGLALITGSGRLLEHDPESMIRKSGNRFSLATNAERVCAEIMLKQRDEIMIRFNLIGS
jgi:hypothetical protein